MVIGTRCVFPTAKGWSLLLVVTGWVPPRQSLRIDTCNYLADGGGMYGRHGVFASTFFPQYCKSQGRNDGGHYLNLSACIGLDR